MTVAAAEESYQPSDLRIELLKDARGVYGIGTVGTLKNPDRRANANFIVRPDRIAENSHTWGSHPTPQIRFTRETRSRIDCL